MSGAVIALIQFGSAGGSSGGSGFLASALPSSVGVTGSRAPLTTPQVTAVPLGGTGPYTYSWAWAAGGDGIAIVSSTTATTTFKAFVITSDLSGTAICTITDSTSSIATTNAVSVSIFLNTGTGGGGTTRGTNTSR